MKLNKRAAIEISITTVVILIIAITVLGLAIPFIKNVFTKATDIFGGEFEKIQELLKQDLTDKGELLNYKSTSKQVSIGKELGLAIGVRNTATSESANGRICFRLEVKCLNPFKIGNSCDRKNQENEITIGGVEFDQTKPRLNWFNKIKSEFNLKENEVDVIDAIMIVNDVRSDTYEFELNLYKATNNRACNDGAEFSSKDDSLYASKTFEVDVK